MPDFASQRRMMVDGQLRTYDVTNATVLEPFLDTPRELFVARADRAVAYIDRELPMLDGHSRLMMTPMVLARLIQSAEIGPQDNVLVVGCGSGYGATIVGRIAGSVTAVEEDPALVEAAAANLASVGADRVKLVSGPLADGAKAYGSYTAILVEGAMEVEPVELLAQLREGGLLAGVWGKGRSGRASLWTKSGGAVSRRSVFDAAAPVLPGFARPEEFAF